MRVLLLLLSAVCFAIAVAYTRRWDVLWLDVSWNSDKDAQTWGYIGAAAFALSFLPWGTKVRYWKDQP
jgi:drug/metabolite transporter (DMT)-like permease